MRVSVLAAVGMLSCIVIVTMWPTRYHDTLCTVTPDAVVYVGYLKDAGVTECQSMLTASQCTSIVLAVADVSVNTTDKLNPLTVEERIIWVGLLYALIHALSCINGMTLLAPLNARG